MKFWKLHGIGNDFIAIDGRFDEKIPEDYGHLAKKVCNRRFSVGADGLLVVKNSKKAASEMVYYNSDGSRASMCGNGLRCFVKFIYDNNIVREKEFDVDTLDGVKKINIRTDENEEIQNIKVNMGKGTFLFIEQNINALDKEFKLSYILMGVPHAVILVDKLDIEQVHKYGSAIEKNGIFPQGTNVNFVKVQDNENISVYTWERGCGYTLGCGTGMTASAIICNYLNKVKKSVNVTSQGGTLRIDIDDFVYMTGEAVKICEGTLEV
ncbi:MAG: diaminopimelate epimerase [Romboutsia sp.]